MNWIIILEVLYFFAPAGIANMMPVLVRKIPILEKAVSNQYFGKNKTWRGIVFAILGGMLTVSIQRLIGWDLSFFSYSESNFLLVGFLLGLGAIVGDLVESYFKRKVGKKPGESWLPWDQLDFIFGGVLFVWFYVEISLLFILIVCLGYFLLHLITNFIGYLLKLRKAKI